MLRARARPKEHSQIIHIKVRCINQRVENIIESSSRHLHVYYNIDRMLAQMLDMCAHSLHSHASVQENPSALVGLFDLNKEFMWYMNGFDILLN